MKVKLNKENLITALQITEGAVITKTTLPILSNILIETQKDKMIFNTTDLEIGIIYQTKAEVLEEGSITVPAKRFYDIIKELPEGEITLTAKKNHNLIIDVNKCSFRLIGLPKEEYPSIPEFNNKENIILSQNLIKKLLKKVSFAMSKDEARHTLNGTYVVFKNGIIQLVATDGKRVALTECPLSTDVIKKEIILPAKTINELNKNLKDTGDVKIIFAENQAAFELNNTTIISRLIEGEFPNYEQVIPKESEEKIRINKELFFSALKRASLLTSSDSQSIKLDIFKNKLVVSKVTPDIGEVKEEINTEYKGQEITMGFNPGYLLDVLKILQDENVRFEVVDAEKPCVFREELSEQDGFYVYLVLPMQLA